MNTLKLREAIFVCLLAPLPSLAQPAIDQNKYYYLVNLENSEVMENPGHKAHHDNRSEAKLISSARKAGDHSQHWKFIRVNDLPNLYMIVNRKYSNYIDVPYGRKNEKESVFGYRNKGGNNQQFYLVAVNNSHYLISSKISGLVLTPIMNNEEHCLYRKEDDKPGGEVNICAHETARYIKQMNLTGERKQKWAIKEIN